MCECVFVVLVRGLTVGRRAKFDVSHYFLFRDAIRSFSELRRVRVGLMHITGVIPFGSCARIGLPCAGARFSVANDVGGCWGILK